MQYCLYGAGFVGPARHNQNCFSVTHPEEYHSPAGSNRRHIAMVIVCENGHSVFVRFLMGAEVL